MGRLAQACDQCSPDPADGSVPAQQQPPPTSEAQVLVVHLDHKTQVIMMVCSLTQSQTSWNVKSSGPEEASLQTKLVEVMEFQLSYFKRSEEHT